MKLFGSTKKRAHLQNFLTTMKDVAERAAIPNGTGDNDPQKLFDRLHEACFLFGKVNNQKVDDAAALQMVYQAADSVLGIYHREDGLIEWENIEDILRVQGQATPACDLNDLLNRHRDKIAPVMA